MLSHPRVAVVLVATNNAQGKIVRWASDSKVNHAMIVYEDLLWSGFWKAEAVVPEGVVKLPFDPDDPEYTRVEFYIYGGDLSAGLQDGKWMVGADYDYVGAIFGTVRLIFRRIFGTHSDMSIHDHEALFCFEFVINILQGAGVLGASKLSPENTSPAAFRKWLMEHEHFRRISVERFTEKTSEFRALFGGSCVEEKESRV